MAKLRFLSMWKSMTGSGWFSSQKTAMARQPMPMTNIQVMKESRTVVDLTAIEEDFECGGAEANHAMPMPSMLSLPLAERTLVRSASKEGGSWTKRPVRKIERMPIGMLMRKTQRQL